MYEKILIFLPFPKQDIFSRLQEKNPAEELVGI